MQTETLSRSPSPALSHNDTEEQGPSLTLSANTSATSLAESEEEDEEDDPSSPYFYQCNINILKDIVKDIDAARAKLPTFPIEQEAAHKLQWRTCLNELVDKYGSEASTSGPLFTPVLDELFIKFTTPEVCAECPCCYNDEDQPVSPVVVRNVTATVLIEFLSNHLFGDDGGISTEDMKKLELKGNVCIESMTWMFGDGCLWDKMIWVSLDGVKEQ